MVAIVDVVDGEIVLRVAPDLETPGGVILASGSWYEPNPEMPISLFINKVEIVDGKPVVKEDSAPRDPRWRKSR